ncbi:MAG TPA: hypothetical protein VEK06_01150 [Myxococcota bacterium]|nr:hypothetical protein [Myxococcota bacterium]
MSAYQYTAKLYIGKGLVNSQEGDDETVLYEWMLTQAQNLLGDVHGEVIDNRTHKVVQRFRKSPPD